MEKVLLALLGESLKPDRDEMSLHVAGIAADIGEKDSRQVQRELTRARSLGLVELVKPDGRTRRGVMSWWKLSDRGIKYALLTEARYAVLEDGESKSMLGRMEKENRDLLWRRSQ